MNEYAASLLRDLFQNTLETSLLIGLIVGARILLKERLSVRWHYALWFLICFKILIPWTPHSAISVAQLVPDTLAAPVVINSDHPVPAYNGPIEQAPASMSLGLWLTLGIWISGMACIGIYLIRDYLRLTRLIDQCPTLTARPALDLLNDCCAQLHIKTHVCMVITDAVQSPALLGIIRPKLLLPRVMVHTFTKRQLRHVFLHELAHLKRHDIAAGCIASLCHMIHWFNPLVWYAFQQMRTDRELACDLMALTQLARKEQSTLYGQTIIRIMEFNRCHPLRAALAGMGQTRFQVRKRIISIAEFQPAYEGIQWGAACLLACLAVTGLTRTPIAPSTAQPVQTHVLDQDSPHTELASLTAPIAPRSVPKTVAEDTPPIQEDAVTTPPDMKRHNDVVASQEYTVSPQQTPQQLLPEDLDLVTMNVQAWSQVQLNSRQIQDYQNRLLKQTAIKKRRAPRESAKKIRLSHRRSPPSTARTRWQVSNHGISGIVQMAAKQTTLNKRTASSYSMAGGFYSFYLLPSTPNLD